MGDPPPDLTEASNVARRGKIASLPLAIRIEINRRLDNGEQGPAILSWLNLETTVVEVLDRLWSGQAITAQNLSEWRRGGYEEWRRQRDEVEIQKELSGYAMKLAEAAGAIYSTGAP